jgi:hypothetical protein
MAMSETGCGFQRAEDAHDPEWFCVVHLCWSSTPDLCPLQRAEAQVQRVREQLHKPWKYDCACCERILGVLDGDDQ